MGGKGQRRREKNYKEAHGGGYARLPPPPVQSQHDALPSKLRKLIAFTNGTLKASQETEQKRQKGGNSLAAEKKKLELKDKFPSETDGLKDVSNDGPLMTPQNVDSGEETVNDSINEKKKKSRKRKHVDDLRFETILEKSGTGSKRRERKKEYLAAKKKKRQKAIPEEKLDFPGHEKIKFGEVVEAPPKLAAITKGFKNIQDASKERIRLRAIEAYRNRKGWASRPGLHLPYPVTEQL